MRSQEEMVNKMSEWAFIDKANIRRLGLVAHLSYDHAKKFIKPTTTEEMWKNLCRPSDEESLKKEIQDIIKIAFQKNITGIESGLIIEALTVLTWLLGEDILQKKVENNFINDGKDAMLEICAHYKWDFTEWLNESVQK